MRRRSFLHGTASAATLAWADVGRGQTPASAESEASPPHPTSADDLVELSCQDLLDQLASGRETSVSLVKKYLDRVARLDRDGPKLNAVIAINPEAEALAAALDKERAAQGPRGPLHGLPIWLKDNLDTAGAMPTTAGSLALAASRAPRDAFVVAKLRAAGALILGKTNLSEWANFRGRRSTSGWSGHGGLTRNPYVLDHNPSGSSSGSAVAAAASLGAAAVGTETNGSILSPASCCGIVGLKPTVGLVSRRGIIPIAHTFDTAGPMTRTVRETALLLGAMAGADPEDPDTAEAARRAEKDYTTFLKPEALHGRRLGWVRQFDALHPVVETLRPRVIALLREHGAEVVEVPQVIDYQALGRAAYLVMLYEFKADLNAYLTSLGEAAPVRTLAEVIAFNEQHADRELVHFGQETLIAAEALGDLSSPEYVEALTLCRRVARNEGIDAVMNEHRLDALLAPTRTPATKTDLQRGGDPGGASAGPAAIAGYPSLTLPAGWVGPLPVGVNFFGRAWSEPVLLGAAFVLEQALQARKPPAFLPSLPEGE